jgi:superfamily II DNA or RNA helicase
MSVHVALTALSNEELDTIESDLCVSIIHPKTKKSRTLQLFKQFENTVALPFFYGQQYFKPRPLPLHTPFVFQGTLRPEQKKYRNAVVRTLNQQRVCILATHVAFGKSIVALNVAFKIQQKTIIVVNRLALMEQWRASITRFLPGTRVQILTSRSTVDPMNDCFIINLINLPKIQGLECIGCVIVDELHLLVSDKLVGGFFHLSPNYVLGLSATPYRTDGLDIVINRFFSGTCHYKKLWRPHTVVITSTHFKPKHRKVCGKIDWNYVLCQQSENEERNRQILQLLVDQPHNFLVLSKRVEQIQWFEQELTALGISNECLYDDRQPSDRECKVLVGTIQKIGTGFDKPHLDALVVAADVEQYFIQYLGRVFRRPEIIPTIYDFKDHDPILFKHLNTRLDVYCEHGGELVYEE